MEYDVIGDKKIVTYNEDENIFLNILKKALAYAEEEKNLKNIELTSKAKAKILNLAYIILESVLGRFILYFILLGIVPIPDSFEVTGLFVAIYAAICFIVAVFDPWDIYKKLLSKTTLRERIIKKTEQLKKTRDRAIAQYEDDKHNFGKLKELLGEKYGNIRTAKFLIKALETGSAKDLKEAKLLYQQKLKDDDAYKRKLIRNGVVGGGAIYLGMLAAFLGGLIILLPFFFKIDGTKSREGNWWW